MLETHVQHQSEIPPTIPKDPIDDHKTYAIKNKQSKQTLSFSSLLTATGNCGFSHIYWGNP